jgi:hypothetical protein
MGKFSEGASLQGRKKIKVDPTTTRLRQIRLKSLKVERG